jgi:hypothetical protein
LEKKRFFFDVPFFMITKFYRQLTGKKLAEIRCCRTEITKKKMEKKIKKRKKEPLKLPQEGIKL